MTSGPKGPVVLAREKVAAWTLRAQQIDAARSHATKQQVAAMYDALTLGIPPSVVARDADVSRQYLHRVVTNHAANNGLPHPFKAPAPTKENQPA